MKKSIPQITTEAEYQQTRHVLRMLVRTREDFQDMRTRMDGRIGRKADGSDQNITDGRAFDIDDAAMLAEVADAAREQEKAVEKKMLSVLRRLPIYTEHLASVKGLGTKGYLLKRRWWGPRCRECTDFNTGQVVSSECDACYGTGIEGGYYDPIEFWTRQNTNSRKMEMQVSQGHVDVEVQHSRFIAYPFLTGGDVWVNADSDQRYVLGEGLPIQLAAQIRNKPLIQIADMGLVSGSDIIYSIPVDSTDSDGSGSLRDAPMTLSRLTGAFLQAVRYHFIDEDRIYIPALRDLVWLPDPEDAALSSTESKISIEPEFRFDIKNAMNRPYVTIHRGPLQSKNLGIGGGAFQSPSTAETTGATSYHRERVGQIIVSAKSNHGMQVELLVDELDRYFQDFHPHWRRTFQMSRVEVAGIGDVQPMQENKKIFKADINIQYGYQHVWSLTPQSPKLGNVSLQVL